MYGSRAHSSSASRYSHLSIQVLTATKQKALTIQRLLGLMAATTLVVPYAKLQMRPLQLWFNHDPATIHDSNSPKECFTSSCVVDGFEQPHSGNAIPTTRPRHDYFYRCLDVRMGGNCGSLHVQGRWTPLQCLSHIDALNCWPFERH